MEREMVFISWEEFDRMLLQLIDKIKEGGCKYCGVYGIPRGGLVLATCLSHRLNVPLIFDKNDVTNEVLVVDDISDNGTQLLRWFEIGNDIATIHSTSWTKSPPKYSVENKLREDTWIVYPWECREEGSLNL